MNNPNNHSLVKPQAALAPSPTEFLLYKDANGEVKVEIIVFGETLWLTQNKIAQLFGVDRTVVTKHLRNIFECGELQRDGTCANFAQVQIEGTRQVSRQIEFYNLDAILSVGYRVNSLQATHFRIWATNKGVVMYMSDWVKKLDAFLQFNEEAILTDHGRVSHEAAKALAEHEFEKFHAQQVKNQKSDFDKLLESINKQND